MQLSDRSGVMCDKCGTTHRTDFTYYSYDFRLVEVQANRRPPLDQIINSVVIFSLDLCSACFAVHKALVTANYAKVLSPQRRVRVEVVCDLSGAVLAGTYIYYHVAVTKVEVRAAGQKTARLTTDPRHVELNVSEPVYKQLIAAAATRRTQPGAGEWATTS